MISIVTVCTGNICRSPLAEQLLHARLQGTEVVVSSAGLQAVVGAPMDAVAAELSARLGGDPAGAHGRALDDGIVAEADLVLTMTVAQRDELVRRYPRALRRTFTLAEAARLLPLAPDGSLAERLAALPALRGRAGLTPEDDVPDPYRRSREVHEAVAARIDGLTAALAAALARVSA